MPTLDIESILGPEPPRPPDTTDPAYKDYPQSAKKAWRDYITRKQQLKLEAASLGYQPEDLGITGEKEQGQSFKRWLEKFGMLDRNYEYDFASGRKRNVATSDEDAKARGNWVPVTARDIEENQRRMADGGNWRNTWNRIGSDAQNRLSQWAERNEAKGGGIRRDESGRLYGIDDNGQKFFYDNYGARLDAAGNRTGEIYAGSHMQFGGALGQNSLGSNFGGTGGMWGQNTPAAQPAAPPKPANPYFRPGTNPWGTPTSTPPKQTAGYSLGAYGGSPVGTSPFGYNPTPVTPMKMKKKFGAPV